MEKLIKKYDQLQNKYGSKNLNSVYGCGLNKNAKIALVFMNPTKRNIATDKSWKGLKAQWLGTKQVWEFLTKCDLFSGELNQEIKNKTPKDWTPNFCKKVYDEVKKQGIWITNLAKCTQDDARPLADEVFLKYTDLLKEELYLVNPQKVFFFGNQVSSIMLDEKITVSTVRQKKFALKIKDKEFESYALFYPVGNGRFNQHKTIEDIKEILKNGEKIMNAQKNKIYRHYKGDLYIVEDFAIHSDTDELMIIYRALYGNCQLFTKPVSVFEEKLSPEAQIKYGQEYRFELIDIKSKNPDH